MHLSHNIVLNNYYYFKAFNNKNTKLSQLLMMKI